LIWLRLGCSEFHFLAAESFLLDLALRELSRWESLGSNLILDFCSFCLELSIARRCVTPTFYKNKKFVQIGVHIKMHIKL
jgi:hypothetical protein